MSWNGTSLRPLTCQRPVMPGHGAQPPVLPVFVLRDLARDRWARADQAHLAAQDVEQLRQLVQAGAPEEAADRRDARIALHLEQRAARLVAGAQLLQQTIGVLTHRAELPHPEAHAVFANPLLGDRRPAPASRA